MGFRNSCRGTGFSFFLFVCFATITNLNPASAADSDSQCETALLYPYSPQEPVIENYHGHKVADAYRWLEDLNSRRTRSWIDAQNNLTSQYLAETDSDAIALRLAQLWDHDSYVKEFAVGEHKFLIKRQGRQNHAVLYVTRKGTTERQVLIDPNTFAKDATIHLANFQISPDGKYVAYALSSAGSDWATLRIRDVQTGRDLDDVIKWTKFSSITWMPDSKGFYYSRYPRPATDTEMTAHNENNKLYFHTIGNRSSQDSLIMSNDVEKDWSFSPQIISGGKYLLVTVSRNTDNKTRLFLKNLLATREEDGRFVPIVDNFESGLSLVNSHADNAWFMTNDSAPRGRVIKMDLKKPQKNNWITTIAETSEVIEDAQFMNLHWFVHTLKGPLSKLKVYNRDHTLNHEITLPGDGTVSRVSPGSNGEEIEFSFSNEVTPTTIYRYNFISKKTEVIHTEVLPIQLSDYEVTSVSYPSKDGTLIPMRLLHKKGIVLDGTNPTYLYGYGGFNHALNASFTVGYLPWLEKGGVVAIPNLRGGGEFGEQWHEAGKLNLKQNVFDDFIGAAEYLIAKKYTSPRRLAIGGASNGGLLVSAVLMQRPELFGAAVPNVGVHDMLRFQLFTVGDGWVCEYGSSTTTVEEFNNLYRYSPLHNVTMGVVFPPTMIMTADHDDRVVPSHSYKLAATMQTVQSGSAPVLLRVEHRAGHGAGRPMSKIIQSYADQWAFLLKALGVE